MSLQKYEDNNNTGRSARLVTACRDGSIKILSPVTGTVISTLFPIHRDTSPKDLLYDIGNNLLYCICSNGEIAVYHANTSPGRILRVLEPGFVITATCGISFMTEERDAMYMSIIAGTSDGQLVLIDTAKNVKRENLVQVGILKVFWVTESYFRKAHTGTVEFVFHDAKRNLIISGGSGIKSLLLIKDDPQLQAIQISSSKFGTFYWKNQKEVNLQRTPLLPASSLSVAQLLILAVLRPSHPWRQYAR
jgi:hypothetical protein